MPESSPATRWECGHCGTVNPGWALRCAFCMGLEAATLPGVVDEAREDLAQRIDAALTWALDDPYLSDLGEKATRGTRAVMDALFPKVKPGE